jgi:glutathione S-transferase
MSFAEQTPMILVGMFDSPFVRRVAVSMKLLGFAFEHRNWSVGKDADKIRQYSPQGRVPALVLDDGEALMESSAILDHLDERAGPARALLPRSGDARRRALKLIALATGAVDKGILLVYERVFRPADKRFAPWTERCARQMHASFAVLEAECVAAGDRTERLQQPDVTLTCVATYLKEAAGLDLARYPAIAARVARCEAMPAFRECYAPFFAPDFQ